MRRRRRAAPVVAAAILVPAFGVLLWYAHAFAKAGASYAAKIGCSATFLAGRDRERILAEDLAFLPFVDIEVDRDTRAVTGRAGPVTQRAVYREGLGSVLVLDGGPSEADLRAPSLPPPFPVGRREPSGSPPEGVDSDRLAAALERAFAEPDPARPRRARAVLVVYRDRIVGEKYASGIDAETPLLAWSVTKSVLNALVGIRTGEGKLRVADRVALPEWSAPGDRRAAITVEHCLQMETGLAFNAVYDSPLGDPIRMLFRSADAGAYAASLPLAHEPGTEWRYADGTSNILSGVLRRSFDGDDAAYLRFPRERLFDRIGMQSAVIETDPAGTFVGSSFTYATARDWARFGRLYLHDGVFEGERILPEGWVAWSRTPAKHSRGRYGAHFWLNANAPDPPFDRRMPGVPEDVYFAAGFQEQVVAVVPSYDAVIVRLGLTTRPDWWSLEEFLRDVLAALQSRRT